MIVFVLTKDNKIKVVEDAASFSTLIKEDWKHTATINPCMFLENLHNNVDKKDVYKEVMNLKTI